METPRQPLQLRRMTPLQRGLAITCALLLIAFVMLLVTDMRSIRASEEMIRAGYRFSDLAAVQRSVQRLHVVTIEQLRHPPYNLGAMELQRAVVSNQIRLALSELQHDSEAKQALDQLQSGLIELSLVLLDAQVTPEMLTSGESLTLLDTIFTQMSNEAGRLYDREETRFFIALERDLAGQRGMRHMLTFVGLAFLVFGGTLALSIHHSIEGEFERAYSMLETLFRADEDMHRQLTEQEVEETIVDIVTDVFGADKSVLMRWDADRQQLLLGPERGFGDEAKGILRDGLTKGVAHHVARTGRFAVVSEVQQNAVIDRRIVVPERIQSLMHVPVFLGEEVYGVLSVCSLRPNAFDTDAQRLLSALARRAASAMENARAYERAEQTASREERQRLARDLHDAVTQTLFSASLIAEVLPRIWERDAAIGRQRLEELRDLTRGALAEMRALLVELLPSRLLEGDMDDLLRQLTDAVTGRARIPVTLTIRGAALLPPEAKIAVYRVTQEALNNVVKHSVASCAHVTLISDEHACKLEIQDDGQGFDPSSVAADRLGLNIMRERATAVGARLEIESVIGEGTCVRMTCLQAIKEMPR